MISRPLLRISRRAVSVTAIPSAAPAPSVGPLRNSPVDDPVNLNESLNQTPVAQLKAFTALESPVFSPLGSPAAMLSINAPASVPIYMRRHSLTAVYGLGNTSADAVASRLVFLAPIARFCAGLVPFAYQRLVSTSPFSLLVSSGSGRAFASVVLNGSTDWALVNKRCLQAYAGPALSVSMHALPKRVSPSLARALKVPSSTPTGLFSWFGPGYTLLAGRGHAGITGRGSVYSVSVASGELLVVRRQSLLAVSVAGPLDLNTCVSLHKWNQQAPVVKIVSPHHKHVSLIQAWSSKNSPLEKARLVWDTVNRLITKVWIWVSHGIESMRARFAGDTGLVSILGPRQILIQASDDQWHFSRTESRSGVNRPAPSSEDRLSYVTIDPQKGAVFKNTPDFSTTVLHIRKQNK